MDISVSKISRWGLIAVSGLGVGILIAFALSLKLRYTLPLLGAMLMPLIGVLSLNFKRFFQILLIASICLPIRKALVAVDPYLHTGGPFGIEVLSVDFILLILYWLWIYERNYLSGGPAFTIPKAGWYFLGYLTTVALSSLNAPNFSFVIFEIVQQLKIFLLFLYLVNNFDSSRLIRMTLLTLSVFMIFHGMYSILQYVTGHVLYIPFVMPPQPKGVESYLRWLGLRRVGGLLGNANVSATWLVMILPLIFMSLFMPEKRWYKSIVAISFSLSFVALILSGSRAAWLACPSAALIIIYLCFKKGLLSFRRNLVSILLVGALFLVLLLPLSKIIVHRATTPIGTSEYCRLLLMRIAMRMTLEHPLIGNGANNFNLTNIPFRHDLHEPRCRLGSGFYHVVHNLWFLIAADTGLLGLFFFVMILYTCYRNCMSGLRSRNPYVLTLAIALLTSLQSFVIAEISDWSYVQFYQILLTFWLLVSLTGFVKRASTQMEEEQSTITVKT